jgi:hypothetical protein
MKKASFFATESIPGDELWAAVGFVVTKENYPDDKVLTLILCQLLALVPPPIFALLFWCMQEN